MKDRECAVDTQFESGARIVRAAKQQGSVKIAVRPLDQGIGSASFVEAKRMEHGYHAVRGHTEQRPAKVSPAVSRGAIEGAVDRLNQSARAAAVAVKRE